MHHQALTANVKRSENRGHMAVPPVRIHDRRSRYSVRDLIRDPFTSAELRTLYRWQQAGQRVRRIHFR